MSGLGLGLGLPGAQGAVRDPDAAAVIAAMSPPPPELRAGEIHRLVTALKGCGVWRKLDCLFVFAAHHEQAARIDWKTPTRLATAHGDPAFVADRGWEFDGVDDYLDTGFNPFVEAQQLAGTAGCHGIYERTNLAASLNAYAATTSSTRNVSLIPRNAAGFVQGGLNHAGSAGAASVPDSLGLTIYQREGAQGEVYKRGTALGTTTIATAGNVLVDLRVFVGCRNAGGTPDNFRPSSAGIWLAGSVLSAAQHKLLAQSLQSYMVVAGGAV